MGKTGVELIAIERKRQIEELVYDYSNDELYSDEQLAKAGATYALRPGLVSVNYDENKKPFLWPWEKKYWKPTPKDRIKELTKAGALMAAQIDWINNERDKLIK